MRVKRVDIVIPAYNEEANIELLLHDIARSDWVDVAELQHVTVISDYSTDGTDSAVSGCALLDPHVRLIRNDSRLGKNSSISSYLRSSCADIYLLLDADVRLADAQTLHHLIAPILDLGRDLVGCNIKPLRPRHDTLAGRARYFDWLLEDYYRTVKPASYYSCYGRAMAFPRSTYVAAFPSLPRDQADDLYIYHSTIAHGLQFSYAGEAIIYFVPARRIGDYARQYTRYWHYLSHARDVFGRETIDEDLAIRGALQELLALLLRHPIMGASWLLTRAVTAAIPRRSIARYDLGLYSTPSESTNEFI